MPHYILQIDTASKLTSLSLTDGNQLLCDKPYTNSREQAQFLIPEIQTVLAEQGIAPKELNEIRAMIGPGSFTGIRIGLAAAQGLAFGREIPLHGISNFDAYLQAYKAQYASETQSDYLLIALESYRQELFFQLWDLSKKQILATENISAEDCLAICQEHSINLTHLSLIGDGVQKAADIFKGSQVISDETLTARQTIGSYLHLCQFDMLQEMTPYYMRKADAVKSKAIRQIAEKEG